MFITCKNRIDPFGSTPYKALVAFTDVVKDAKDGQEYTEATMTGFPRGRDGGH